MSGIIMRTFSKKNEATPLRFDKDMYPRGTMKSLKAKRINPEAKHMPGGETNKNV